MISRWTVLNGVLVAIVALLAVEIGRTWMRAVPPLRMPAAGDGAPRRDAKTRPAAVRAERSEEDVALITSMDLFDQSRQAPGSVTDVAAPVEVPPPTGIEVVGIRLIAGDQEAFIRDASQGNAQRRVRTGDEVAGFTVQSINATAVELGNPNGQNVTLYLQLAPSAGGAKPGVPAAVGARRPPTPPPPTAAGVAGQQGPRTPPTDPAALRQQQRLQQRQQRLQQLRQQKQNAAGMPAAKQQRLDVMREKGA